MTTRATVAVWPALAVGAGLLVSLGAFLPWITAGGGLLSLSRSGIDGGGDGILFAAGGLAMAVLGLAAYSAPRKSIGWALVILGALGAVGVLVEYRVLVERIGDNELASIGVGIWAMAAGAILGALAGSQVEP